VAWKAFEWRDDPAGWNQRLLSLPYPHLLQSWEWGALQERFGWRVRRLAVDLNDHPRAAASIQEGRAALPGAFFWYIPRGPAVADADREGWAEWLRRTRELALRERLLAVRLEPESCQVGDILRGAGYQGEGHVQPPASQIVDLGPAEEDLRATFKPKTRYNLGLAERRGVEVEPSRDLELFSRLVAETAQRQRIHLPGRSYFQALVEVLEANSRLYVARAGGTPLAAILVAWFGPTAYYLYGGDSRQRRELMPNYLLHWTAMRDAQRQGCRYYDLWGMIGAGLQQFKAGFGGQTVHYLGVRTLALRPAAWRAHRALAAARGLLGRVMRARRRLRRS